MTDDSFYPELDEEGTDTSDGQPPVEIPGHILAWDDDVLGEVAGYLKEAGAIDEGEEVQEMRLSITVEDAVVVENVETIDREGETHEYDACSSCGFGVNPEWDFCPNCSSNGDEFETGEPPNHVFEDEDVEESNPYEEGIFGYLPQVEKDDSDENPAEVANSSSTVTTSIDGAKSKQERLRRVPPFVRGLAEAVDGVDVETAVSLSNAGYHSTEELREASQQELAEVDGVGRALAARIKADIGGIEDTEADE